MTPEERQKRMEERLAAMTPEERERFQQRMRERAAQGGQGGGRGGFAPGQPGQGGGRGNQPQNAPQNSTRSSQIGRVASTPSISAGATTIDALFGPLPQVESRGRAWLFVNKQLKSVPLRLGITDTTYTEVLDSGGLEPGAEVVINLLTGLEPKTTTPGQTGGSQNPLMGPQRGPQRGGPGGGGGGRGR
jgi:hypothetical protein